MSNQELLNAMLELERPTAVQYENFVEHIATAHSWYKHIPLLKGTEFTVLLNPHAGGNFDEDNPRPHYSWRTTEEYRRRFGYLDFGSFENWNPAIDCDAGTPWEPHLHERFSFRMFPYVRISTWAVFFRAQNEDIQRMTRGEVHPEGVSEFIFAVDEVERLGVQLSEQDWLMIRDSREPLSDLAERYMRLRKRIDETHHALVAAEKAKIRDALRELKNWLESQDR